jgi:hypothetical protein
MPRVMLCRWCELAELLHTGGQSSHTFCSIFWVCQLRRFVGMPCQLCVVYRFCGVRRHGCVGAAATMLS